MRVRVAVLGASGFVGGHIVRVLRGQGAEVRPVVRNAKFAAADPHARVADALDVYALRDALAGCDYVVHSVLGPQEVILGSLAPTYAAAQAVGVRRLVYISTGSVHGQSPEPGTTEQSPLHVRHAFAYNNAKVRAERKLQRLRRRGTVELVMLRPTIVFGPGSRWIYDFAAALRDDTAYVIDGARGICNSIYVDNLGYAVHAALTAPGVDREVFFVSDAETVTWADFYRELASGLGFDFDAIPSVSPPDVPPNFRHLYIEPFRTSELGIKVIAGIPPGIKTFLRTSLRTAKRLPRTLRGRNPASPVDQVEQSGALDPKPRREITPEMIALQRCRWRLPNDKAIRLLGYAPPVTFAEGCRRSVEWLQHQGYGKAAAIA